MWRIKSFLAFICTQDTVTPFVYWPRRRMITELIPYHHILWQCSVSNRTATCTILLECRVFAFLNVVVVVFDSYIHFSRFNCLCASSICLWGFIQTLHRSINDHLLLCCLLCSLNNPTFPLDLIFFCLPSSLPQASFPFLIVLRSSSLCPHYVTVKWGNVVCWHCRYTHTHTMKTGVNISAFSTVGFTHWVQVANSNLMWFWFQLTNAVWLMFRASKHMKCFVSQLWHKKSELSPERLSKNIAWCGHGGFWLTPQRDQVFLVLYCNLHPSLQMCYLYVLNWLWFVSFSSPFHSLFSFQSSSFSSSSSLPPLTVFLCCYLSTAHQTSPAGYAAEPLPHCTQQPGIHRYVL